MRVLAALAVAALLLGGLAYAATSPALRPAGSADAGARDGALREVEPDALLPRAREEVAAYGQDWALTTVAATEQAQPGEHDGFGMRPDPHPGNGLAPLWMFQFQGPQGMAFAAIKADGTRAGLGWMEGAPPMTPPPLPAWKVGSAAAVAKAREDPALARVLDAPDVSLSIMLAMQPPLGAAEGAAMEPWWQVHAWREAAQQAGDAAGYATFRVHAMDGRVEAEPQAMPMPPGHVPASPGEPCCAEERSGTSGGSIGLFSPVSRNQLDAPGWPGSEGRFVLSWQGSVDGLPAALELRILGPDLEPVAVAQGASPLRLDAADLPAGPLFAEVRAPDGEVAVSASYELAWRLLVPPYQHQGWEEVQWFGGSIGPLDPGRSHYVFLREDATAASGLLLVYPNGLPAVPATLRVTLEDASGRALATAEGTDIARLDAGPLPAGEYWLRVEAAGPQGLPAGASPFASYSLELRALHAYPEPEVAMAHASACC